MNTPTFAQLDQLAAEVLPERTVMSVVVTPVGGGGAISDGGGGGGATTLSACTTSTTFDQQGVVGLLGLGQNNVPITTQTCTPSAIATY